jgi:DNA-damage-inducible protein J
LTPISNEIHNKRLKFRNQTMTAQTSMLHVRVDDAIKAQAVQALGAMGLSVSDAVRLFLHRVVAEQAFPLELKVPNAETRAAFAEIERGGLPSVHSVDELMKALHADD